MRVTPTPDKALDIADRRGHVVELRRQRKTWQQIGDEMGVSKQRAHKIYQEALAEYPASRLGEHRHEELDLIDQAVSSLLAIAGDDTILTTEKGERPRTGTRTRVEAWSAIRGWSEWRGRLLGLNAPTKSQVDIVAYDGFAAQLERLRAELGESTQQALEAVTEAEVVEDHDA